MHTRILACKHTPEHMRAAGGDVLLPDGLLYYRCNLGPKGTVLMHQPRMPAPPPAIKAAKLPAASAGPSGGDGGSGSQQQGDAAGASATPGAVSLPPLSVPCPEVEAVIDICQVCACVRMCAFVLPARSCCTEIPVRVWARVCVPAAAGVCNCRRRV